MAEPLIQVAQLTRRFGDTLAVDRLNFTIDRGEIVGFLGPNGAGKTTTLRMLTSFLPPSAGQARIAGFDCVRDSQEVRRKVGYLPEAYPVYPEMRITEYLSFRAKIKEIPRKDRQRKISAAVERCGLGEVRTRIVGQLSRGYRQRLGLADALLHDPPILILDEPTVGLDPNQVRQARELIRGLGEDHTVFLSTHILPEVEALCGRVLILHHGRLVAEGEPGTLKARLEQGSQVLTAEIRGPANEVSAALAGLDGTAAVTGTEANTAVSVGTADSGEATAAAGTDAATAATSSGAVEAGEASECTAGAGPAARRFRIVAAPDHDLREAVFRLCVDRGWVLLGLRAQDAGTLEDLFVDLTTREEPAAEPEPEAPAIDEAPA